MSAAAAIPLPVIPELEEATGPGLGAEAARLALAQNDDDDNDDDSPSPAGDAATSTSPTSANGEPGETEIPGAGESQKVKPAKPAKPETPTQRRKKLSRLKRDEVITLHLDLLERFTLLETRAAELERELAVRNVVGNEVVDASVSDLVGDVIDLADSAAQFAVMPNRAAAAAVALEKDERDHLVTLGARVAKLRGGEYVQRSPELALAVAVISVVAGKFIAVKTAKLEQLEPLRPGVDAPRETVAAATPAPATPTEAPAAPRVLPAEVGLSEDVLKKRRGGK